MEVPAPSVDGSGSRMNSFLGFSLGRKMEAEVLPLAPGVALPARPSPPGAPEAAAAARKSPAGDLLVVRWADMECRGRMRTPERGVSERGVMRAVGRGAVPGAAVPAPTARWVSPTLYSGAGDTLGGCGSVP